MRVTGMTAGLTAAALLLGGGIAVGVYLLVIKVDTVHQSNVSNLEKFASTAIPVSQPASKGTTADGTTVGIDGQLQLPPTLGEEKRSSSEKIIIALSQEKQALMEDLAGARAQVKALEQQLTELQQYQQINERFAPKRLEQQRQEAVEQLTRLFNTSQEAQRFSGFQKQAMALASATMYIEVLKQYPLNITEPQKQQLLSQHLPAYAFCLGDSLEFIANDRQEEQQLLTYLRSNDDRPLSASLREDINTVKAPCLKDLSARVSSLL